MPALAPPSAIPEERKAKVWNPKNKLFPYQRKVVLTEEQKSKVIRDLEMIYREWEDGTGPLRSQLQRWVNNSEGISEPAETPWKGASDLYKPITETRMNITHSFWMSTLRPKVGRLFVCVTDNLWDKEEVQLANDLTQFFNSHRAFNRMWIQCASESFTASMRDGTVGKSLDWVKKVEKKWEIVSYGNVEEFLQKNPVPESLGLSVEKFTEIIEKLRAGETVSLDEEFNVVTKDMPVIDTEELKDVVVYPLTVSRQERTRFMGRKFWLRKSEILQRVEDGIYDKEEADKVIESVPAEDRDQVSAFQDQVEGVAQPETKSDYRFIHGRYHFDYDGDGIEEKLLVTYEVDSKALLQFDKYPLYHGNDFIKLSRFKRRPKRLLGRGICQMLDDLNTEANIQSRFRVNSMAINTSPMIKLDENLKSKLDPNRPENRIRPGGIWWMPRGNLGDSNVLEFGKKNFGDLFREEAFLNQAADNLLGASELRSGRETPNDPRAPAQKTALLLQQSSTRLDDFIFDAVLVENEILDDVLRLYYQFGPEKLKVYVQAETPPQQAGAAAEEPKYIEKIIERSKLNRDTLHLQLSVTSLLDNPDYLRQKWEEIYMRYGPEPFVGNILESRWEILNNIFQNAPETYGKKILMPLKEIMMKMPKLPAPAPDGKGSPV